MIRNAHGENADFALITQFEKDETQEACGFYGYALCYYAGLPGKGPRGTPEDVDVLADKKYDEKYGSHDISQVGGVMPQDMYNMFESSGGQLHYWNIPAISPGSAQVADIAAIRLALLAGFLVSVAVDEWSIRDLDLGGVCPYEWNPGQGEMSHIITLSGPGNPGSYLLAEDPANVIGPLNGNNTVRSGPRRYDEKWIDISWATIIQLVGPDPLNPWMKPIPNGIPTTWPQGFNAQNFGVNTMQWPSIGVKEQAQDTWNSTALLLKTVYNYTANYDSGIAHTWQYYYSKGINLGGPTSPEQPTVNWDTPTPKHILVQYFGGWENRIEWDEKGGHVYDKNGSVTV